ncbi:MAG: hypothetical protein KIS92_04555 [Planctomycetota bacterium]|nr:hypothetical protein [Planctomycetota bacterium]
MLIRKQVGLLVLGLTLACAVGLRAEEGKKEAKAGEWTGAIEKGEDGAVVLKVKDAAYKLVAEEKEKDAVKALEKFAKEAPKGEFVVKGTLAEDTKTITVEKIKEKKKEEPKSAPSEGS